MRLNHKQQKTLCLRQPLAVWGLSASVSVFPHCLSVPRLVLKPAMGDKLRAVMVPHLVTKNSSVPGCKTKINSAVLYESRHQRAIVASMSDRTSQSAEPATCEVADLPFSAFQVLLDLHLAVGGKTSAAQRRGCSLSNQDDFLVWEDLK